MIKFDKMKLVTDIRNISHIDKAAFTQTYKDGELSNCKYEQKRPFHLSIVANQKQRELTVEFSGKILLDAYPDLINKTNIRKCLEQVNSIGVCVLDVEAFLCDSHVVKCDVTKDITHSDIKGVISDIELNLSNRKKWVAKDYRGGLTVENVVSTPRCKKRLTVYDKRKELEKADNADFLSTVKDKDTLLSYFADKVRFELNINTMAQIRSLLNIPDTKLQTVLNATANPILAVIDKAVRYEKPKVKPQSLRDYERMLLIKECGNDMAEVEAKVRSFSSHNTSITRAMRPFRELFQRMQASTVTRHSDWRKSLA